jgi:RHS repeat-associated protein
MVKSVAHTNGMTETIAHDPNRLARPGSISASSPFASWTTGAYTWDGVGNVKTMGGSWFLYDKVSRLKEAHVKTGPSGAGSEVWQAYSYDGFGNLTGYVGTVGRNLPTDLATNKLNAAAFDDRGNMTGWSGHVYTWTGTDQLERHQIPSFTVPDTGENWYHLYTVDDERLVSVDWKRGAKYLRFRDLDGKILREVKQTIVGSNELWSVERDYIYRGATLLAAETPQGRRHFHPDHLGTPRLITNATGHQVAFHTYYPFGEEATAPNQDAERLKFTGHERDFLSPAGAGDDLDAMRARYCSPITGRFLGVDPAGGTRRVTGSWNRFTYVLNNPVKLVDPLGLSPLPALGRVINRAALACYERGGCGAEVVTVRATGLEGLADLSGGAAFYQALSSTGSSGVSPLRDYYQLRFEAMAAQGETVAAFIDFLALEFLIPESDSAAGFQVMMSVVPIGRLGKLTGLGARRVGDLISGSLKRSSSYRSELADKTYQEIVDLARSNGPQAEAAKKMKKLVDEAQRLQEKISGKPQ